MSEENEHHGHKSSHESKDKSVTLTLKKNTLWKAGVFLFLGLFVISLLTGGFGLTGQSTGSVDTNPNPAEQQPSKVSASVDDDPVLGQENAPVTIIEFSDYQCPFCRKFWTETFSQVKEQYIDTGKAKLIYRDFPLTNIHPMAAKAAEAAECVQEQAGDEAYFEMHDKIFAEQNVMDGGDPNNGPVKSTVQFTAQDLKDWANELGYDIGSCLDSGQMSSEVQSDLRDGQAAGGRGTPYFVINGKPLSGAQPFSAFQQAIESEL